MENTFGIPIIPINEKERLTKLHGLEILDTQAKGPFNHLALIATKMFGVPISLISLVDKDRVWFKANVGMEGVTETARGISICSLAILKKEVTLFENALLEPCLLANPLVQKDNGIRFYAAAPLITSDGFTIGVLCLVDLKPHEFSESDKYLLEKLASLVMEEIERK